MGGARRGGAQSSQRHVERSASARTRVKAVLAAQSSPASILSVRGVAPLLAGRNSWLPVQAKALSGRPTLLLQIVNFVAVVLGVATTRL